MVRNKPIREPGIYAIVNKVNGHMYIGSSKSIHERWWSHQSNLRKGKRENPILLNAYAKYGKDAFEYVVIELVEKFDDPLALRKLLEEREQYYIDTLHPEYNVRPIAENNTGYHPRPESIEKMKASLTGLKRSEETKEIKRQARLGMKFPDEWCENIRKAKQDISPETRAKQSAAKKGKALPQATLDAAAASNRDKPRSQEVKDKISETKRRKYQEGLYPYLQVTNRDPKTGRIIKKQSS